MHATLHASAPGSLLANAPAMNGPPETSVHAAVSAPNNPLEAVARQSLVISSQLETIPGSPASNSLDPCDTPQADLTHKPERPSRPPPQAPGAEPQVTRRQPKTEGTASGRLAILESAADEYEIVSFRDSVSGNVLLPCQHIWSARNLFTYGTNHQYLWNSPVSSDCKNETKGTN
jgi:hypothetical protein